MTAPSTQTERRAFGPGARRTLFYSIGGLAGAAVILGGYAALRPGAQHTRTTTATPPSSGSAASGSNATYGTLPGWLPKSTIPVGRIVSASAAHPWLAVEGDTVVVHTAHGTATVTTVGPYNNSTGMFPLPAFLRSTFVMTFTHASGQIPISPTAFVVVDEHGRRYFPRVESSSGGKPPTRIAAGAPVSIHLIVNLSEGSGLLRWSPDGQKTIVGWDYTNEYD